MNVCRTFNGAIKDFVRMPFLIINSGVSNKYYMVNWKKETKQWYQIQWPRVQKLYKQPLQVKLGITTSNTPTHNCTAGTHMHMITDYKANSYYKTTTCKLNIIMFNWTCTHARKTTVPFTNKMPRCRRENRAMPL